MNVEQSTRHQHKFDRILAKPLARFGESRKSIGKLVGPGEMVDAPRRDVTDDVAGSSHLASGAADLFIDHDAIGKVRRYEARCGIRFTDLERRGGPPPDLPPAMVRLRVVDQEEERDIGRPGPHRRAK